LHGDLEKEEISWNELDKKDDWSEVEWDD